jgi:hypothetical protein
MPLPPVPHNTGFQDKDGKRISQPWLQWIELLRRDVNSLGESGTIAHSDLTGVTSDQHHPEAHTHELSDPISHSNLTSVTSDQHHDKAHQHNGTDGSDLIDYFGPVVPAIESGLDSYNGLSGRISRSDHQHGTPAGSSSEWWASRRQLDGGTFTGHWHVPYQRGWENTSLSVALNQLYAMPFFSGNASSITGIGIYQSISATASYRIGLYNTTSESDQYPSSLISELGIVAFTATGAKFTSVTSLSQAITPNSFYWIAIVGSATASMGATSTVNMPPIFGHNSLATFPTLRSSQHIKVAFTYAALPDPFTAGGTVGINDAVSPVPNIYLQLA